jgi:hypothetical protein
MPHPVHRLPVPWARRPCGRRGPRFPRGPGRPRKARTGPPICDPIGPHACNGNKEGVGGGSQTEPPRPEGPRCTGKAGGES